MMTPCTNYNLFRICICTLQDVLSRKAVQEPSMKKDLKEYKSRVG